MARLLLTTEGQTEQAFAVRVLQPHLAPLGVYVVKPRCAALCREHGVVHRGGVVNYQPLREDIQNWIRQDRDENARFSTMIDLYGLPSDFPGVDQARRAIDPYQRVAILEQAFADDINSQRFIPYIQLHEFESLLLADQTKLCDYYGLERLEELTPLKEVLAAKKNPELIDDGEGTAPSKRIADCIPEYAMAKSTAGPIVAEAIGLMALRQACRHFNEWIERLEALGLGSREQP